MSTILPHRSPTLAMARLLRSIVVNQGDPISAHAFVQAKAWHETPNVEAVAKALVTPIGTASDLVAAWIPASTALVEALMPLTVYGRLQASMRRVPFRTSVICSTNNSQARFVGEYAGAAQQVIPVTKLSFAPETGLVAAETLNYAHMALIVVFTLELIRRAPPGTDEFIGNELVRALVKGMDIQFIDPSRGYDAARDAPASITAGGTELSCSGAGLAEVDADLQAMVNALVAAEMPLTTAHWVMSPHTAVSLSKLRGSGGAPAYPQVTARGGTLLGLPILTTTACAAEGSPAEYFIACVEAGEIFYADDNAATIEYAQHASVQADDAPSGTAGQMVSLWQHGLTAAKVIRYVNWRARPGATAVLRNVTY